MKSLPGKTILLSLIISFLFISVLKSQSISDKEFIKSIKVADQVFYFEEDYDKASAMYEALSKKYPQNSNILAKLGISYLNMDGKQSDALRTLEKASSNVAKNDEEFLEYGQKAPVDTWFYLAKAYHINDSLNRAIELYTKIRKNLGSAVFRTDYVDKQIKACQYAIEMKKNVVRMASEIFIPWLKDFPGASFPVLSQNDSVFIFTLKEKDRNHIYCSFNNSGWEKPVDITNQLGGYGNICSNSMTARGDVMIVYMDDGTDGNLFISSRKGQTWSRVKKLNKNIDSKYWEAFGFITPDGKHLYFSSNRSGGYGDLDIWVSDINEDNNWGTAVNLGNTINTSFNENYPSFNQTSGVLIFSSEGHSGMGGYDIFSSIKKNRTWTVPIGFPYPVNSTSNELNFIEDPGHKGLIASIVDKQTNVRNIYRIQTSDKAADKIIANGSVGLQDGMNLIPDLAEVKLSSSDTLQKNEKIIINEKGDFKFNSKPGEYLLQVRYPGYKTDSIHLIIPEAFSGRSISVSSSMIPDKVYSGDFLSIKNILFDFDSDSLNTKALYELGKVISILNNYPELKIEVRGYTDIKGTTDYNFRLAQRRTRAVIDYFISNGISASRFTEKAIGASDFVAINSNPDGTDNPEGRQYNRRVSLGIINPQTGISIIQESYTPAGLRESSSMRFNIVLLKTSEKYYPDYFSDFSMDELLFVRPVLKDTVYIYVMGEFHDISDAESYLIYARKKGFNDAYIVNSYEVQEPDHSLLQKPVSKRITSEEHFYTIQLSATRTPLKSESFSLGTKVVEKKGKDGWYRYIFGEFDGFAKAKTALDSLQQSGQKNAFIKDINLLNQQ